MRQIDRSCIAGWLRRWVVSAAVAVCAGGHAVGAQTPILLEGLADGEFWSTTPYSNLLTRNAGHVSGLGRLQLWGAVEPLSGLVFFAQGQIEGGRARVQADKFEADQQQYGVRYAASALLVVDAGKLQPVIGTFTPRHFSNRNPLIGDPDTYSLMYPYGVVVSGETAHFDYRAGMVSLPATHVNYVPPPSQALRPAIGAGFTPTTGIRIGGSFTAGPYLNDSFTAAQLRNESWRDYHQHIVALDATFSRGYLETRAEAARGTYDVPGRAGPILGYTYYGEAKYTFTPRFFAAVRVERNKYPFIRAFGTNWVARPVDFVDGEFGVGYRVSTSTLVKASTRADRWWVAPGAAGFLGQGGPAMALQISQSFDVMSWFARAR